MFDVDVLLARYQQIPESFCAGQLEFQLPNGRPIRHSPYDEFNSERNLVLQTIYNAGSPYQDILPVRVEPKDCEVGDIVLCTKNNRLWNLSGIRVHHAQDPHIMLIGGTPCITYIAIDTSDNKSVRSYQQAIAKLKTPDQPFIFGPIGQKGCRTLDLPKSKKILGFGRTQEWPTLLGKLTYFEVDTVDEVGSALAAAPMIPDVNPDNTWVGTNQLILLDTVRERYIGVIMHIARFNPVLQVRGIEKKEYFAAAAVFDREANELVGIEIIATAHDFAFGSINKMESLGSVIYPGGICRTDGPFGGYRLYGGVGDLCCFWKDVDISLFKRYIR
jgi:hypothetical protein